METPPHSEYHVRDLGTRCVTLFPARALVVRDIKNVTLKVCMVLPELEL